MNWTNTKRHFYFERLPDSLSILSSGSGGGRPPANTRAARERMNGSTAFFWGDGGNWTATSRNNPNKCAEQPRSVRYPWLRFSKVLWWWHDIVGDHCGLNSWEAGDRYEKERGSFGAGFILRRNRSLSIASFWIPSTKWEGIWRWKSANIFYVRWAYQTADTALQETPRDASQGRTWSNKKRNGRRIGKLTPKTKTLRTPPRNSDYWWAMHWKCKSQCCFNCKFSLACLCLKTLELVDASSADPIEESGRTSIWATLYWQLPVIQSCQ